MASPRRPVRGQPSASPCSHRPAHQRQNWTVRPRPTPVTGRRALATASDSARGELSSALQLAACRPAARPYASTRSRQLAYAPMRPYALQHTFRTGRRAAATRATHGRAGEAPPTVCQQPARVVRDESWDESWTPYYNLYQAPHVTLLVQMVPPGANPEIRIRKFISVSYTHLRAHET